MKRKKVLSLALAAAMSLGLLSACGGGTSSVNPSDCISEAEKQQKRDSMRCFLADFISGPFVPAFRECGQYASLIALFSRPVG